MPKMYFRVHQNDLGKEKPQKLLADGTFDMRLYHVVMMLVNRLQTDFSVSEIHRIKKS